MPAISKRQADSRPPKTKNGRQAVLPALDGKKNHPPDPGPTFKAPKTSDAEGGICPPTPPTTDTASEAAITAEGTVIYGRPTEHGSRALGGQASGLGRPKIGYKQLTGKKEGLFYFFTGLPVKSQNELFKTPNIAQTRFFFSPI